MLSYLQGIGMLRREADATVDLITELFVSSAKRLVCPTCGLTGLAVQEDVWEDEWEDERHCQVCNAVIPAERLEVFPDAQLCPTCQQKSERGEATAEQADYCRHCGGLMVLRQRSGSGLAGYRMVCSDCGR